MFDVSITRTRAMKDSSSFWKHLQSSAVGFYPMAKGQRTRLSCFQIRNPQRSGRKKEA
jgi:hypothetical protein